MLNDIPHAAGLFEPRLPTPGQLNYIAILSSRLRITIQYEEQVKTFGEAGRMISELKAEEAYRKKLKGGNPSSSLTTKAYHATHKDNLESIMLKGLDGRGRYLFFFSTLEDARESALSDMVILEVVLLEGDIDKCKVGEIFPELYEGEFGKAPPEDVSLRSYIEHPAPYGLAEIYCTINGVPPERIKHVETVDRLRSSNPNHIRLERTTVTLVINDLERTWHRIAPDMSIKMQSALGILKHAMGFFYEDLCVAAWDNGNLIGIAVYETTRDVNLGIQDTRIKELASFTYEPGVGKALVEEVIRIAREENSDIVSLAYGPGAREFYEKLGFVRNTYYPAEPTLMMYRL